LITDAVAETTTGPYQHVFKGDRYTLPIGTLSGSSLTMMKAVKNCIDHVGIDIEEALRMGSLYPARVLGIENKTGLIERNYEASFVVFDNDLNVIDVFG
jgi:N-acetylglucosamine-6-phosphate deacetylase